PAHHRTSLHDALPILDWRLGTDRDPYRTAAVGAGLSNVINNLPAYKAVEEVVPAGDRGQLLALLVGTNVGPVITPWASLATLLWFESCRRHGVRVPMRRFLLTGAGLAVVGLVTTTWALVTFGSPAEEAGTRSHGAADLQHPGLAAALTAVVVRRDLRSRPRPHHGREPRMRPLRALAGHAGTACSSRPVSGTARVLIRISEGCAARAESTRTGSHTVTSVSMVISPFPAVPLPSTFCIDVISRWKS